MSTDQTDRAHGCADAAGLAHIGAGFASPGHGAQQVFRATLDALSRPGTLQRLPSDALAGVQPPGIGMAQYAVLLTLLDAETRLFLTPDPARDAVAAHLRFHTGVRLLTDAADADFVATRAAQADTTLLAALYCGSDEAPQTGATLIIEVPLLDHDLDNDGMVADVIELSLCGPGIRDVQALRVGGLTRAFWRASIAGEARFPRGVDLILTCGDVIAALPRTTHVQLDS